MWKNGGRESLLKIIGRLWQKMASDYHEVFSFCVLQTSKIIFVLWTRKTVWVVQVLYGLFSFSYEGPSPIVIWTRDGPLNLKTVNSVCGL